MYLGLDRVAIVERRKDDDAGVAAQRNDANYTDRHDRDRSKEGKITDLSEHEIGIYRSAGKRG